MTHDYHRGILGDLKNNSEPKTMYFSKSRELVVVLQMMLFESVQQPNTFVWKGFVDVQSCLLLVVVLSSAAPCVLGMRRLVGGTAATTCCC